MGNVDYGRRDAVEYAFGSGARTLLDLMKYLDKEAEKREKPKPDTV